MSAMEDRVNSAEHALEGTTFLKSADPLAEMIYEGLSFKIDPKCAFLVEQVKNSLDAYKGPLDVAIDIGAHVGVFSLFAAKRGATVYSFEPCIENCTIMMENFVRNKKRVSGRIRPFMLAVTGKTGDRLELRGSGGNTGMRSLKYKDDYTVVNECLTVSLKDVVSDIMKFHGKIDYLKMDTEGSEWDCINSADDELKEMLGKVGYVDVSVHPLNMQKFFDGGEEVDYDAKMRGFLHSCGLTDNSIGRG